MNSDTRKATLRRVAERHQASPQPCKGTSPCSTDTRPPDPLNADHERRLIERRKVKRRTDVVGNFPNTDALLRLASCADRAEHAVSSQ
jgi:hypothetical protein